MVRTIAAGCLLAAVCCAAQDRLVERSYEHFYNLEYADAIAGFEKAIARDPSSPDLHNHLAEAILFREMHRNGALESELVTGNNPFLRRPRLNTSPETDRRFLDEIGRAMDL